MYLGIDIGGTKTLMASLDNNGVIKQSIKVPTDPDYDKFLETIAASLSKFKTGDFRAAGVAVPGRINREEGIFMDGGNLVWHHVPVARDLERLVHCPVFIENDANLGALSEAMLLKHRDQRVLYVTISTGIGTGLIDHQHIEDPDMEGGQMLLEFHGKRVIWEDFASGRSIVERYGKRAADINDKATWQRIVRDLAVGFYELVAIVEPEVIVIGGSVGTHFKKYHKLLEAELKKYNNPITPIPKLLQAQRPEEAVVYGCYDFAKSIYSHGHAA
jgi:glucokinase